jgi:hypothetical protein
MENVKRKRKTAPPPKEEATEVQEEEISLVEPISNLHLQKKKKKRVVFAEPIISPGKQEEEEEEENPPPSSTLEDPLETMGRAEAERLLQLRNPVILQPSDASEDDVFSDLANGMLLGGGPAPAATAPAATVVENRQKELEQYMEQYEERAKQAKALEEQEGSGSDSEEERRAKKDRRKQTKKKSMVNNKLRRKTEPGASLKAIVDHLVQQTVDEAVQEFEAEDPVSYSIFPVAAGGLHEFTRDELLRKPDPDPTPEEAAAAAAAAAILEKKKKRQNASTAAAAAADPAAAAAAERSLKSRQLRDKKLPRDFQRLWYHLDPEEGDPRPSEDGVHPPPPPAMGGGADESTGGMFSRCLQTYRFRPMDTSYIFDKLRQPPKPWINGGGASQGGIDTATWTESLLAKKVASIEISSRREHEAWMQEARPDVDVPCKNKDQCEGRSIPDAEPITLVAKLTREEEKRFQESGGKWRPSVPRSCILCERAFDLNMIVNARAECRTMSPQVNLVSSGCIVDQPGEYVLEQCYVSSSREAQFAVVPFVMHCRRYYRQVKDPLTGRLRYTQPGYHLPEHIAGPAPARQDF